MPLSIDIVSDVVCPWCFVGSRRLFQALERTGHADAEVTFHPFLLDPSTPTEGVDLRARLQAKYGVDPEAMFPRVEAAARESGIPLDFAKVRKSVSTVAAHTLLRHAADRGTQRALADALFSAYFLDGLDIGDTTVLASIAEKHGFTADEALALTRDPAELARTRGEATSASKQGITGVPFTIMAGKIAVSGAQPVEVFERAIAKAAG